MVILNNVNEMIHELISKGMNHRYYYHYTNLQSLRAIKKSGVFLLGRGNRSCLNDQYEIKMKGSLDVWPRVFYGSFNYGSTENIGMWCMYGKHDAKSEKIRIGIPQKLMLSLLENAKQAFTDIERRLNSQSVFENEQMSVNLHDMMYFGTDREFVLKSGDKGYKLVDTNPAYCFETDPEITGYIKNLAWSFEDEIRLYVKMIHSFDLDYVKVLLPEGFFNDISIMTGPWTRLSSVKDELDSIVECSSCTNERVTASKFYSLINID